MTRPIRRALSFVVVVALVAIGDARDAHGADDASEHFQAGVAFYKRGDFTAALVEFKRAYELEPNYRVLFNLGQTSQELNDYASALTAFERYLREGGKGIDAARRAKVEGWVRDLEKKVATVTIETNIEGAEIFVDDVSVGIAPLADPIVVNAGRRKIAARAPGHTPMQRAVDLAGTDETSVTLELVPIEQRREPPPEPPKPPPPKPAPPKDAEIPAAAWVMLSLTGASAVVTGVMGGLALSARGDLDDALAQLPGDAAAIEDAQDQTRTFAITTDIFGVVTIAGAVTTAVLFGLALSESGDEAKAEVKAFVTPAGIGIGATF